MAHDPRGWESTSATWLRSACTVLTAALAFQLPAELISPLVRIGPISVTNVEATGYLLLLAWVAAIVTHALPRPRLPAWVLVALGIFFAGAAIAAAFAMFNQAVAAKTLFRMALAMAIGLAAASVVLSSDRRWRIVAVAGLAGATLSAATGLVEFATGWRFLGGFFHLFREAPISIGGFGTRATGTLLHPNLAGWYWGVCGIVTVGSAIERRGLARVLLIGTGLLLYVAVALSLSRGALIGMAAAGVVLAIRVAWHRARTFLPTVAALIGPAVFIVVALSLLSPLIATRLTSETDIEWYRFRITAPASASSAGAQLVIPITVTNDGPITWPATGTGRVLISYHVRTTNGSYYDFAGVSTGLARSIPAGQSLSVNAPVLITGKLNAAIIEWDLEQEGGNWFSLRLPATLTSTRVTVAHPQTEPSRPRTPAPDSAQRQVLHSDSFGRSELWRIALEMIQARPIIGIGLDNFRLGYGAWRGLSAWNTTINTNNLYLELLVSVGLFALPLGAVVVAALLWLLRRAREATVPEALWLVTLVALLAHGVLDSFVLFSTALYLTAFGIMGGVLTRGAANLERQS